MSATISNLTCSNCRQRISQPKYARKHRGRILCINCYANATTPDPEPMAMLSPLDIAEAEPVSAEALSYATPQPVQSIPQQRKPKNLKGDFCVCPNCGYRGNSERRAKGSMTVAIVLLCLFAIPGIIYYFAMAGYRYYCPRCGIKVGSAYNP